MTTGNKQGMAGGSVPTYGESELVQQTAATDFLTLTGASSMTGDFLVLRNSSNTELWYVVAAGRQIMAVTHSGTSALASLDITTTDATTYSSGYGAAIYLRATNSGAKTGSANTSQWNVLAEDITIAAAAPYITGAYFYFAQSGSPTLTSTSVLGMVIFIEELGATDRIHGLSIEKANTTLGTNYDTFIRCACQGSGVTSTGIYFTGTHNPTYFLQCQSVADCFDAGTGASSSVNGHIKVKLGSTDGFLRVYASAS
jgi:hypothetical protein